MLICADWVFAAADLPPISDGAVRVLDGVVHRVGPSAELRAAHPDDDVVDASGHVVMPGFVNAHVHLYGTLAHGIPMSTPVTGFWSFLADYWWPKIEDSLDAAMIAAATDWVCAEMLRTGTTTFYDILEAPHAIPEALLVEAEVTERRGIRGILSFEATERVSAANGEIGLQENVAMIRHGRRQGASGLVTGAMCWHTLFTCSEPFVRRAVDLAREHDVFFHAHCNEGVHEGEWSAEHHGMRTAEFYARVGVLGDRFLASQCVQLSERERELIATSGTRVSHMPLANCEVGGGIAPIPELLVAGTTVGLGTDGYLNDMFQVMRGAFLLHKARLLDPGAMPAATVLQMATEGGARALGLERVGRLEPGWSADLQVVAADLPTPLHDHNLLDQLVLWRDGRHVRDVMVAGMWRVRNGEVLSADLPAMRARVHEQAERLWARA